MKHESIFMSMIGEAQSDPGMAGKSIGILYASGRRNLMSIGMLAHHPTGACMRLSASFTPSRAGVVVPASPEAAWGISPEIDMMLP